MVVLNVIFSLLFCGNVHSLQIILKSRFLFAEGLVTRHPHVQIGLFIKWKKNTLRTIKLAQCRNSLCLYMLNKPYHYALLGAKWYFRGP